MTGEGTTRPMISEKNYNFLTFVIFVCTPFTFSIHPVDFRDIDLLFDYILIIFCKLVYCGIQFMSFIKTFEDTFDLLFCQMNENLIEMNFEK